MSNLEMRINAMCAVLVAETAEDRNKAVEDLKQAMAAKENKNDYVEGIIQDLFLEFGIPDHLKGYAYLVRAVQLAVENVKWVNNITFGLYPKLALEYETTPSRVERAIRNTITGTFDRGNQEMITNHFGSYINPDSGKVANSEFIARMANLVKHRLRYM